MSTNFQSLFNFIFYPFICDFLRRLKSLEATLKNRKFTLMAKLPDIESSLEALSFLEKKLFLYFYFVLLLLLTFLFLSFLLFSFLFFLSFFYSLLVGNGRSRTYYIRIV